jgi:hypothetical protein
MAYLMDDIVATARAVTDRLKHREPMTAIFPATATKLEGTPRFLLDDNVTRTIAELTLSRPKVILEALPHLTLPYPRMWVEWAESGREHLREAIYGTDPIKQQQLVNEGRPIPKRLGFLIEATDESLKRGTATWFWSGAERLAQLANIPIPNAGPISPYFDLDPTHPPHPLQGNMMKGLLAGGLPRLWTDNPVQLKALQRIWETAQHLPNEWGLNYIDYIKQHERHRVSNFQQELEKMYADVFGEYIVILATLLLLTSSRTIVDYTPISRFKLNKSRKAKRAPLLLDHTEVTLHIGEYQREGQRRQPLSYTRKSPRIHMVQSFLNHRGDKHWIVQPFWRGQGETIHRRVKVTTP